MAVSKETTLYRYPVQHPITTRQQFTDMLQQAETVTLTKHFAEDRLPFREHITVEQITAHLSDPAHLITFTYQPDQHSRPKYAAVFDHTDRFYLKVVLSIAKDEVYIITAYVTDRDRTTPSALLR